MNLNLKRIILESGMKGYEVARKANIHHSRLSAISNGYIQPSKQEREAISEALKCSAKDVFNSEGVK
jgi:transcriptional regulator with XRE-family HTH domain